MRSHAAASPARALPRSVAKRRVEDLFAAMDVDRSGTLSLKEVEQAMVKIKGPATSTAEAALLFESMNCGPVRGDSVITPEEFEAWYMREACGIEGQKLNRLLIKDTLAHSRAPAYKIPPAHFTYGRASAPDSFDAKATLSDWHGRPESASSARRPRAAPADVDERVHGGIDRSVKVTVKDLMTTPAGDPAREAFYPTRTSATAARPMTATGVRETRAVALMRTAATEKLARMTFVPTLDLGGPGDGTKTSAAREEALAASRSVRDSGWKMSKFKSVPSRTTTFNGTKHEAFRALEERTRPLTASRHK